MFCDLQYKNVFLNTLLLDNFSIIKYNNTVGLEQKPLQFYMETYRSGHNGADSKSVREQSPASSNLAVSAKDNRNLRIAVVFFM